MKAIKKGFLSEETQRGHMRDRPAGLQSTKVHASAKGDRQYESDSDVEDDEEEEIPKRQKKSIKIPLYVSLIFKMN